MSVYQLVLLKLLAHDCLKLRKKIAVTGNLNYKWKELETVSKSGSICGERHNINISITDEANSRIFFDGNIQLFQFNYFLVSFLLKIFSVSNSDKFANAVLMDPDIYFEWYLSNLIHFPVCKYANNGLPKGIWLLCTIAICPVYALISLRSKMHPCI